MAATTIPTTTATRLQAAYLTPATPTDLFNNDNPIDHCSICLLAFPSSTTSPSSTPSSPFEEDDTTTTTSPPAKLHPCSHIFCQACITRHLHADGQWCSPLPCCPMCRAVPVAKEGTGGDQVSGGGVEPVDDDDDDDDDDVCFEDMLEAVINRMVRREIERALGRMAVDMGVVMGDGGDWA